MEVQILNQDGQVLLTANSGESMKISIMEFWQICRVGARLDVVEEVQNYLADWGDGEEIEGVSVDVIGRDRELFERIVEGVMDVRVKNESGDQIWDAMVHCCREHAKSQPGQDGDKVRTWHGEVDVPYGFPGLGKYNGDFIGRASERFILSRLEHAGFLNARVDLQVWRQNGLEVLFSFESRSDDANVAHKLQEVFEGLNFEAYSDVCATSLEQTLKAAKSEAGAREGAHEGCVPGNEEIEPL